MSHFVTNLKWMFGGQVNPLISIIIDNNNNNNDNNSNNNRLLLDLRMFYDDDADDYLYFCIKAAPDKDTTITQNNVLFISNA